MDDLAGTADRLTIGDLDDDELADPFADDLDAQLAARAPGRWFNRATLVLAGLALLAVGFLGGAQVQKHFGAVPAGATQGQQGGAFAGGGAFGAFGAGGAGGAEGAGGAGGRNQSGNGGQTATASTRTGSVKLVDGNTVYLQTSDGQTVIVHTNGSTSVQLTHAGSLADLTPGTQVSVEGTTGSDGSVTATKVSRAK